MHHWGYVIETLLNGSKRRNDRESRGSRRRTDYAARDERPWSQSAPWL